MKNILKRKVALIALIVGAVIFCVPFIFATILLGIDKANVGMSYAMQWPMNNWFGDNLGTELLNCHKRILKNE